MNRGGVGWGGVGQGGAGRQRSQTRGGLLLFRSLALVGAAFFGRERWSEGGTSVWKAPSDNRARQPGLSTADACPVVPFDDRKKKVVAAGCCFSLLLVHVLFVYVGRVAGSYRITSPFPLFFFLCFYWFVFLFCPYSFSLLSALFSFCLCSARGSSHSPPTLPACRTL